MKFDEFNLNDQLLEAISYMGFETATLIQEKAIPAIMEGKDLIAFAQTGTGKTAAFVLPVLHKLAERHSSGLNTLIIVPTRELAIQIDQQIQGFSYFTPVHSFPVYGGRDGANWDIERKSLTENIEVIVATPGKMIAHLNMGYVKLDQVKHLILDEADKMLDMGFYEDIQKIVSFLPKERQTLMFSATMPSKIKQLASRILTNPVEISIELAKPPESILQAAYLCYEIQKIPLINSLIADKPDYKSILIFTSTKSKVSEIVRGLKKEKYSVAGISSDLEQQDRESVLSDFRSKRTRVLIATDVLSRGIDIKDIDLIINYDAPMDAEDYVHRIGRTARAQATGVAITMVNEKDMNRFKRIEGLIEQEVIKLPLPVELGEGPAWNPNSGRNSGKFRHYKKKGPARKGKPGGRS